MKFKILVRINDDPPYERWEEYTEAVDDAEVWARKTVEWFNSTLRPNQKTRTLLKVEVIDAKEVPIVAGRTYRAKTPRCAGGGYFNDRHVMGFYMGFIQYDGPAVAHGKHFPKITVDEFVKWMGEDVTDKLPRGGWQPWGKS
jgi:hypothetical protein